jgi:hypothetical protein
VDSQKTERMNQVAITGAGNVPLPSLLKYPDLTQNILPLFAAYHIPEIGRTQQECAFRESLPI